MAPVTIVVYQVMEDELRELARFGGWFARRRIVRRIKRESVVD